MQLESYDCKLCLLQSTKVLRHLFYKCPFAKTVGHKLELLFQHG
jgi:hypothetical protein